VAQYGKTKKSGRKLEKTFSWVFQVKKLKNTKKIFVFARFFFVFPYCALEDVV